MYTLFVDAALATVFFKTASGKSPVMDYVNKQDVAAQIAILSDIEALAEEFPNVVHIDIKHLVGKVWEIRTKDDRGVQHRVLYAVLKRDLVLLHAFKKKEQKTRREHIDLALKRLKEIT